MVLVFFQSFLVRQFVSQGHAGGGTAGLRTNTNQDTDSNTTISSFGGDGAGSLALRLR